MKHSRKNILLIQLGDIGDIVLSIPAFRSFQENFPDANIVIAVREKARELIQCLPGAYGLISINKDDRPLIDEIKYQWAFFVKVRRYQFDLAFDFRTGTRGAVLAFLSGAKERISFFDRESFWRNKLFTKLYHIGYHLPQYVASYYLGLPMAYGLKAHDETLALQIPPAIAKRAADILKQEEIPSNDPLITIQPFSLWQYKEWSTAKYIQLIERILQSYKVTVLITGSRGEHERAQGIVDHFKDNGGNVWNLAGLTKLGELAAILKSSLFFIGSDSAGMHIAAAVGTPTIIIFGPSSPASWAPRGNIHTVIQKNMTCIPCRQKGCDNTEVSRCLEELDVDEVFAAVRSQYERK